MHVPCTTYIGSSRKYYYRSPIRDQHVCSETNMPHRRPTCLIRDRHASSETNMPHRRPTCPIGDRPASSNTNMCNRLPKCVIRDPSKTDMLLSNMSKGSLMRHVGYQSGMSVSDGCPMTISVQTSTVSSVSHILVNMCIMYYRESYTT